MAVTWTVNSLDVAKTKNSLSDVVINVHWYASDIADDGKGSSFIGSQYGSAAMADPDSGSFTPYADLEKDTVIGWAKSALGADEVAKIEANIAAQLAAWESPPTYSGVPWTN